MTGLAAVEAESVQVITAANTRTVEPDWTFGRVLATFSQAQIDKALALVGDNAIVETGLARTWVAVSSDGITRYLVTPDACQCPAGRAGRPCYHRCASAMLTALAGPVVHVVAEPAAEAWVTGPARPEPDADRCADCGHQPGCQCPHDCEPRGTER
jgi:hypothetical protein